MDITIAHFVNPHHFYFKNESSDEERFNLELEVACECQMQSVVPDDFAPDNGDIVAVLIPKNSVWVRAVVDQVLEFTRTDTKYLLWAIDRG